MLVALAILKIEKRAKYENIFSRYMHMVIFVFSNLSFSLYCSSRSSGTIVIYMIEKHYLHHLNTHLRQKTKCFAT
jgi:hypothetical protein